MITMIAIGVEHPGKNVQATVESEFYNAFLGVTNIIFAYGGHLESLSDIATKQTDLIQRAMWHFSALLRSYETQGTFQRRSISCSSPTPPIM